MEHAGHVREIADDAQSVLMRLALMDHDGKRQLLRKLHLHPERPLLHVSRRVFVVIIQTDLSDGLHARVLAQRAVFPDPRFVHLLRVVRVAADGGPDPVVLMGQLDRVMGRRAVAADLHHAGDVRCAHFFHNVHKVLCKTVLAQMGVRIKIHRLLL